MEASEGPTLVLFMEGVVKPRLKQLLFHSGSEPVLPTSYNDEMLDEDGCPDVCEIKNTITDDSLETEYKYSIMFTELPVSS